MKELNFIDVQNVAGGIDMCRIGWVGGGALAGGLLGGWGGATWGAFAGGMIADHYC